MILSALFFALAYWSHQEKHPAFVQACHIFCAITYLMVWVEELIRVGGLQ